MIMQHAYSFCWKIHGIVTNSPSIMLRWTQFCPRTHSICTSSLLYWHDQLPVMHHMSQESDTGHPTGQAVWHVTGDWLFEKKKAVWLPHFTFQLPVFLLSIMDGFSPASHIASCAEQTITSTIFLQFSLVPISHMRPYQLSTSFHSCSLPFKLT